MRRKEAVKVLGLRNGFTASDVREACLRAVKAMHPDAGGKGGDMHKLIEARDLLLSNPAEDLACPQCKGRGSIRVRLGNVTCVRCGGTGDY